jgi:hypothetical protein
MKMWLAHGSQVIDHITGNKEREETRLVGQIFHAQACGKGMKNRNKWNCNGHNKRVWVRVRKRGKNKEKCVSGATFLTGSTHEGFQATLSPDGAHFTPYSGNITTITPFIPASPLVTDL